MRDQAARPVLSPGLAAARARRVAALADFDVVASDLHRLRSRAASDAAAVDPSELVAAEARTERARERFWAADQDYQSLLDVARTG
jgi:hypothetical protein